jgi:hypothetical protein
MVQGCQFDRISQVVRGSTRVARTVSGSRGSALGMGIANASVANPPSWAMWLDGFCAIGHLELSGLDLR